MQKTLNIASTSSLPRIGVIGGGHLGRIHAKLAMSNRECMMIGVADPSPESRGLVESQLNVLTVPDYELWDGAIDAAIIAAPTFLHHRIGAWCLSRGIHVFVEKPIASTLQEASELSHLARANDLVLQIGHVERFNPAWQLATKAITRDSIRYIESAREGTYTGRSTDIGIVMDLMIHDLDLILSSVDSPVVDVHAYGWSVLGDHEDFATANIQFKNGTVAQLRASRVSPAARRSMQIYSDNGLTEIDFATGRIRETKPVDDVADGTRQADRLPADQRAKVKDSLFENWLQQSESQAAPINAIECEQQEFLAAVRTGSPVTVTGAHGCRALELASRIIDQISKNTPSRAVIPAAARFGQSKAA